MILLREMPYLNTSSAYCEGTLCTPSLQSFDTVFYSADVGGSTVQVCSSASQDFVLARHPWYLLAIQETRCVKRQFDSSRLLSTDRRNETGMYNDIS